MDVSNESLSLLALLGVAIASTVALVFAVVALLNVNSAPAPDVSDAVRAALAEITPAPAESTAAYERASQSFVIVQVDRDAGAAARADRGLGSGVVANEAGDILTSRHVVVNADRITVIFSDGTESVATVTSSDPDRDIAVLRAERGPSVLVPAVMGRAVALRPGDPIYVIGNPLGLDASVSSGIVSGLNRTIPIDDGGQLEGLIQFDAAVNPGSSGGPLVNSSGQVVGIVTALANLTDQSFFSGIAFAVPIEVAAGAAGGPDQ